MRSLTKMLLSLSTLIVAVTFTGFSYAADFIYKTLDYPGAVNTWAYGVYSIKIDGPIPFWKANVVGTYKDSIGKTHGFLYDGSSYRPLDWPNAQDTFAFGINGKNIVGEYRVLVQTATGSRRRTSGFLYDGATYTDIAVNNSELADTSPRGRDVDATVGFCYDPPAPGVTQSKQHGYVHQDGSTVKYLLVPNSSYTQVYGKSGSNYVGEYQDWSTKKIQGFLFNIVNQRYTPINAPGATWTRARGVSGNTILGYYADSSGKTHGFLYNGSTYSTIDVPGATETRAYGMSGPKIVGTYTDSSGKVHGFIHDKSLVQIPYHPSRTNTLPKLPR